MCRRLRRMRLREIVLLWDPRLYRNWLVYRSWLDLLFPHISPGIPMSARTEWISLRQSNLWDDLQSRLHCHRHDIISRVQRHQQFSFPPPEVLPPMHTDVKSRISRHCLLICYNINLGWQVECQRQTAISVQIQRVLEIDLYQCKSQQITCESF